MKVKKLKDGRWQVIQDDGRRLSATLAEWTEVVDWMRGVEDITPAVKAAMDRAQTKPAPVPNKQGPNDE